MYFKNFNFPAKNIIVSLSQIGVGLEFCLKDLGSTGLPSGRKVQMYFKHKLKVTVFDPEDSVRSGPPQRLFCRSRRALQNSLWVHLDSTYPWKVIQKIKICINLKNRFFSTFFKLKFEGEDSVWKGWAQRQSCSPCRDWPKSLLDQLCRTTDCRVTGTEAKATCRLQPPPTPPPHARFGVYDPKPTTLSIFVKGTYPLKCWNHRLWLP